MTDPVICWFRQDLRLSDNPAFTAACATGAPVIPLYILDDESAGDWKMGGASRAWLGHSLTSLGHSLDSRLIVRRGRALDVLRDIARTTQASHVFWNRCYEPWRIARDKTIKEELGHENILCQSSNGSLLWEPWDIQKSDGTPYRVFTPFYRRGCLSAPPPRTPLPVPASYRTQIYSGTIRIDSIAPHLEPKTLHWHRDMMAHWQVGEDAAQKRLAAFLEDGLRGYKDGRNYPARNNVSRLSPHLHFGEISPNQVWAAVQEMAVPEKVESDADCLCSELGWREFSHSLLYYNPHLPEEPLNSKFRNFPWADANAEWLERWHTGQTGYALVDAGLRELWATGYMHNRVRMVVGSFLVKNLRYHWRYGEDWFWDTLVDADLANNAASWQWVGGCGADAAPYFRIFNPVTQGEKFDPNGEYIARWAPDSHKIKPMLDHKASRDAALEAFKAMK